MELNDCCRSPIHKLWSIYEEEKAALKAANAHKGVDDDAVFETKPKTVV
jgi:hypothetical protein